MLFVDDCTRMMWLYGMKHKSDVVTIFPRFYQMIQTQFMLPLKFFRFDNDEEFVNSALSQFFHTQGVLNETTCLQTPQQNGVAKRKNGQILATVVL